jgi:putative endonuclease
MITSNRKGELAERWAKWILRCKGYHILAQRFRCPVGEIDLIVRSKRMVIAVEVKQRSDLRSALEAVTTQQQRRIARALQWFMKQNKSSITGIRFDVFVISTIFSWHHLKNAWQTETHPIMDRKKPRR